MKKLLTLVHSLSRSILEALVSLIKCDSRQIYEETTYFGA